MTYPKKVKGDYEIISINTWNDQFFTIFCELKNKIHEKYELHLKEEINDLKQALTLPYIKLNNINWEATIIQKKNELLGRVINFYDPSLKDTTYFGYLEYKKDPNITKILNDCCEDFCLEKNQAKIKGPINAHFFVSYRLKLSGDITFFGEPDSLPYYQDFFKDNKYTLFKSWKTVLIDPKGMNQNFKEIKNKHNKKDLRRKDISIKRITPWSFENDIKTIYDLFNSSYSKMSEFQPIDFKSFYELYKDFKFIVNPLFSFLIYYKKRPYAFNINLLDPLHTIIKFKNKYQNPTSWQKLKLLIKIFLGNKTLLFLHVGKIELENEPPIKGITSMLNWRVYPLLFLFRINTCYTCYIASDSKSNDSFRDEDINLKCTYGVFQKILE